MCLVTGYNFFCLFVFDQNEIKKISFSVQRSVVESFSFRAKNVQSVHVPDLRECLVNIDVSRAIGYVDDNNGRRAIKRHVPKNIRCGLKTLRMLWKDTSDRMCHKMMQSC